ncbi:MAG: hypothetical protein IPL01_16815 [Acidobacteria bacterium]|nr:hypothetical protein [Acidobacteriota bacterium]
MSDDLLPFSAVLPLNLRRVPNGTVTLGRAGYTINTSTTDRNTMLLTLRVSATPAQQQ